MKYTEFVCIIEKKVNQVVGKDMRVELHTTMKNNGKELVGLIFQNDVVNITPVIYLEEYYVFWEKGMEIQEIVELIWELYDKVRQTKSWDTEIYSNYGGIRNKLVCKLINFEKNKKLLEDSPFVKYLDFAIVFYALIHVCEHGTTTMMVKTQHVESWGISVKQLFMDAIKNSVKLLPAKLLPISSVINEILDEDERELYETDEERMYVLSNSDRNLGASCILYPEKLEDIGALLGENYYVLPSSIHEVIIVPESKAPLKEELESMVREINETQLDEEEVLSNHVYYYKRDENSLEY